MAPFIVINKNIVTTYMTVQQVCSALDIDGSALIDRSRYAVTFLTEHQMQIEVRS